jgi:hypothetical protein
MTRRSLRWRAGWLAFVAIVAFSVAVGLLFRADVSTVFLTLMWPVGLLAGYVLVYLVDRYTRWGRSFANFVWEWAIV